MKTNIKLISKALGIALVAAGLSACGDDAESTSDGYTQIERLGRPAINEALILDNKNLNAFNRIGPSQDLETTNTAIAAVVNEASATLSALNTVGTALGLSPLTAAQAAAAFLPDVMRIDTSKSVAASETSYNLHNSAEGGTAGTNFYLTGGRKITDDVVDMTLTALLDFGNSSALTTLTVKDNVPYTVSAGVTNPSIGHGATSTSFPFLAAPN